MEVSGVVAAYNSAKQLRILLESLRSSSVRLAELCICDDASTDETQEVLAEFAEELNIKVVRHPTNRGVTAARNSALAAATSPYVFLMDADIRVPSDTLERLIATMERTGADVVEGGYSDVALDDDWFSGYYALFVHHSFLVADEPIEYNVLNAWCALCRAEVLREVGGFGVIEQGVEIENEWLGRQIVGAGHRLVLDPSIHVDHHWGGYRKLRYIFTSRVYWWVKTFFASGMRFEKALTTASYGVASLALPAAFASLPLVAFGPVWALVPAIGFATFLHGYSPFFRFALARRGAGYTLKCVAVSGYFSFFVTASALWSTAEELARRVTTGRFTLTREYGQSH